MQGTVAAAMGPRQVAQGAQFRAFPIETFLASDAPLRAIGRVIDLSEVRRLLAPCCRDRGSTCADREPTIRMPLFGCCTGTGSERRLRHEMRVDPAYRLSCRLDPTDRVPDRSSSSGNRHGRFCRNGLSRHPFESEPPRALDGVDGFCSRYRDGPPWWLLQRITKGSHPWADLSPSASLWPGMLFQVHVADRNGIVVIRRQLRRSRMLVFFARLGSCLAGMEACAGAHHRARELAALGHEVRLMRSGDRGPRGAAHTDERCGSHLRGRDAPDDAPRAGQVGGPAGGAARHQGSGLPCPPADPERKHDPRAPTGLKGIAQRCSEYP